MFKKETKSEPDFELFSVYDSKIGAYSDPMFAMNQHDFVRSTLNTFTESIKRQQTNKYLANAEDYSIFRIGSYFRKEGKIIPCNPEHIVNMHELRTMVQNETKQERNVTPMGEIPRIHPD